MGDASPALGAFHGFSPLLWARSCGNHSLAGPALGTFHDLLMLVSSRTQAFRVLQSIYRDEPRLRLRDPRLYWAHTEMDQILHFVPAMKFRREWR
jgi:hypothetical protein